MSTLGYKGYEAVIEFDADAEIFHGEVINTRDVITFQGRSPDELKTEMAASVEDYLAFCAQRGETPDKPFSGQFVVRAGSDLHRRVAIAARRDGVSLNKWITSALDKAAAR
jgi:predicted HicB family RNase H-like nuclease